MKRAYFFIFLTIIALAKISSCLQNDEFPVRIQLSGRWQLGEVKQIIMYVEDYSPKTGEMKAYVDWEGYAKLLQLGYFPVVLEDTSAINAQYALTHPDDVMYHNYTQLSTWAHNLAVSYPSIVRLDSIGPSVQGRWIWCLRITDNVSMNEKEPEFFYGSTIHGNEPVGTEFLIWLCDSLTQRYGTNARLTRIVDSLDLYIIPMINPDGNALARRTNANSVDLNRNFPVPDGVTGEDGTYSLQPETAALISYLSQRQTSFAANFHTGAVVANYPWDFDTVRAPDDALFIDRCLAYSSRYPTMYYGDFDQGITNGYDWYEADGSLQDWDYHENCALHITIELSNTFWPSDASLPSIWANNYEAMVHLLELAISGLHGIVIDSVTGNPISARIWFDQPGRWVKNQMPHGDFHHQFLAGTYSITVVADGYYPKRVTGIYFPHDSASVNLTVALVPADTIYFSNFEATNGGLTTQSFTFYQDWEWGTPSLSDPDGPIYVPSGSKLWTTRLSGDYRDSSQSRLILSANLTEHTHAALVFDEWYRFQAVTWATVPSVAHDGGRIRVATSSDTVTVKPPWGYVTQTSTYNFLIPSGDSIFADDEPGTPWHKSIIFLDEFCGQPISIWWDFGSSTRNRQLGWYIDNVAIVEPSSALVANDFVENLPEQVKMEISPNPFNSNCVISIEIANVAELLNLEILDVNGRSVHEECLHAKSGVLRMVWKPTEDIPSGIYFVNAKTESQSITRRAILIR